MGPEEIGAITVAWGVCALVFREWILRLDLVLRERLLGFPPSDSVVEQERRLLEFAGRGILAGGLLLFVTTVGFQAAGLG